MRLIDSDALNGLIFDMMMDDKMADPIIRMRKVIEIIDNQPTAYDVEAVVAELEKLKVDDFGCSGMRCSKCNYQSKCFNLDKAFKVALDRAISIVRGKE